MSKKTYFVLVVVLVALLPGCGGSSDSGITVETGALSKAQFIKQADEACKKGITQLELDVGIYLKQNKLLLSQSSAQATEIIDTIVVPDVERQIAEISSLGAPSSDKSMVTSILTAMQQALDRGRGEPAKFLYSKSPFAKARKLAKAYGMSVCGIG